MDVTESLTVLAEYPAAIAALARVMSADQARWRPTPTDWSVLEVINHLVDEERDDFRARLDFVLHQQGKAPTNHPGIPVADRAYNQRDLGESLDRFQRERQQSLAWLRGLGAPDWSRAWETETGRLLRAGDLLVSWVAHDLLHLRQLVELQYLYRAQQATPYRVDYAGDW